MTEKTLTGFEPIVVNTAAFELLAVNPGFMETVLQTERALIDEWANSEPDKTADRERTYMKLQLLNELLAQLDGLYGNASVAAMEDELQATVN